ncbi:related to cytidylyltransferase family protein [Rhynchosporium agropyri]|uniref:Related to cytidylyltransferase family protein n=1 Tax=Rhynchosporium agropyri TaxID=914238 RepID=A0A1E1KL51_9HELO|nr:related to cytidylyltransferase family protein [Rhynchosporium agropyri]
MSKSASSDPDPMLTHFRQALQSFRTSKAPFRILSSIPKPLNSTSLPPNPPPKTIYILDSSFNPPTLAHARIILSALQSSTSTSIPHRVLLLLAIQNADKAPKPASFEERLAMMEIFAGDLLAKFKSSAVSQPEQNEVGIDIGVTTLPYFAHKYPHISPSEAYPLPETEQVHLIGYDTLVRLLDTKYYPPSHTLKPIQPFLKKHRVRVSYRADDEWGDREAQDSYLNAFKEGQREDIGGLREWVTEKRIEMVEGRKEGEDVISSTKVRKAIADGDQEALAKLVTMGVKDWILRKRLYTG